MMYIDQNGGLYQGDMRDGDREATAEEVPAWEAKRARAAIPNLSPRQIRQALTRAGLRAAVEAAVTAGDQDLKDWWEFATTFERGHPMVIDMGAALGQSPAQLDALWMLGASL